MLARQVERRHQASALLSGQLGVHVINRRTTLGQQLSEGLQHQCVLAFEVRVETTDGQPRRAHDFTHTRFGRAALDQRGAGGLQNAFAGLRFFIAHHCLRCSWVEYYYHNNI